VNVLLVSPWFPSPAFGGALIRVFETLRHLSRSHRVTLLAPVAQTPASEHLRALTDLGIEVNAVRVSDAGPAVALRLAQGLLRGRPLIQGLHFDAAMARELRRLTTGNAYDVIHVEHSFMAPYVSWISPDSTARTLLSMHNVESLRFRREMHVARWGVRRLALAVDHALFGSWEERAVRQFDAIAAVSPLEQTWARDLAPSAAVGLIPNGVNLNHFKPVQRTGDGRAVVFTGLMNYPPNVDAVVWFCDQILPLVRQRYPDVTFSIVGDKPTAAVQALARRAGVEVWGRVPDVRPHLANADALVVPVRSGAGTRLKILEAMAMRRPVVATSLGAEGLDVKAGSSILIGDTAAEFADRVCELLANPRLGEALGEEGRRLVEGCYGWPICFRGLDALYGRVARRSVLGDMAAVEAVAR
jgi:sugar transferase (PEP-CTERM/EpsH1 system associated)